MDARHATAANLGDDDAHAAARNKNTMHMQRLMNQLEQRVSEG